MSILSQVRRQVVHKGKLRYGAASRIASLLGLSQYAVRRVILGDRALDKPALDVLERAVAEKTPLFTVRAKDTRCSVDGCKAPGHADGKCRKHYYKAWANGISGN